MNLCVRLWELHSYPIGLILSIGMAKGAYYSNITYPGGLHAPGQLVAPATELAALAAWVFAVPTTQAGCGKEVPA